LFHRARGGEENGIDARGDGGKAGGGGENDWKEREFI
jgi:hypothetical protein